MFSHYVTRKISPICKFSTFSEDLSFLYPRSHLKNADVGSREFGASISTATLYSGLWQLKCLKPLEIHLDLQKSTRLKAK